jgi:hypothetical protein
MGLNVSIITTNKNRAHDFEAFTKSIGLKIKRQGNTFFEGALPRNEAFVDVFFTEKGSLLFVPIDEYKIKTASKTGKIAAIVIHEVTNTFTLRYAEQGKMKRIFTNDDGDIYDDEGTALPCEEEDDFINTMSLIVEEFTGKGFWDFENDIADRYVIIN